MRYVDAGSAGDQVLRDMLPAAIGVHYAVSLFGLASLLVFPARRLDKLWPATPVPIRTRVIRYFFWFVIFALKYMLGLIVVQAVHDATRKLDLVSVDREDWRPHVSLRAVFS